jgi:hypothetical protein
VVLLANASPTTDAERKPHSDNRITNSTPTRVC